MSDEMLKCPRCTMSFHTAAPKVCGEQRERYVCPDCKVGFSCGVRRRGAGVNVALTNVAQASEVWGLND